MKNNIKKIRKYSWKSLLLLTEAMIYLEIAWFFVFILPFRSMVSFLGRTVDKSSIVQNRFPKRFQKDTKTLDKIKWAINTISRLIPSQCTCLVQAFAAKQMLRQRHIESTLCLGLSKSDDTIYAHAWLKSGNYYLTGAKFKDRYHPIGMFSD